MPDPVVWGYKAIKAFQAEQPIGSGTLVDYAPGDEVPAGEWGRAEAFMVEAGTIMRYVRDIVTVPSPLPPTAPAQMDAPVPVPLQAPPPPDFEPPAPTADAEEEAEQDGDEVPDIVVPDDATFPHNAGGGWYVLSDGERVRGKTKALAAQAELDVAAENTGADEETAV